MDTRYWGPSGWRLLHLISFAATSKNNKQICAFFRTIPYILPCKYCRQSFSEYIANDPIECSTDSLPKWLWRMHNDVNAKLRRQHLHAEPDPTFKAVKDIYTERLATGCTRTTFEGWEFLFSVAEAHPLSREGKTSTPIHGHPAPETITDPLERNRWNLMEPEERLVYYRQFWELLPRALPFPEWTTIWEAAEGDTGCRKLCLKYLWNIRRTMETKLELLNRTTYNSLCKELQYYRSGCAKAVRGKTCRKKRSKA